MKILDSVRHNYDLCFQLISSPITKRCNQTQTGAKY